MPSIMNMHQIRVIENVRAMLSLTHVLLQFMLASKPSMHYLALTRCRE